MSRNAILLLFLFLFPASSHACAGRLIQSAYLFNGSVCAPENPARIVILDPAISLGAALDFEMPVVGAPLFGMNDVALRARAQQADIVDIGYFTEPSIEKIIGLKPDLIIGSAFLGDGAYNMASQLAPTAFISTVDWRQYVKVIAEIADREDAAHDALAALDARIADLRNRLPETPVSFLRITNWDFQVYLDGPKSYGPFQLLHDLGLKRTDYETQTGSLVMKRPDWEELGNLTGVPLLYIIGGSNSSDTSGRYEEVLNNPLWNMLPAVGMKKAYRLDAGTYNEFSGLEAAHRILDDVETYVIAESD